MVFLRVLVPLILLIALLSCMVVSKLGLGGDDTLAFSHAYHGGELGLSCTDCHDEPDADAPGRPPGMPSPETCLLCHEDLDAEKPPELRVAALFDGETYRAVHAASLDSEVIFSHSDHVTWAAGDCASCHRGIEDSERITSNMAIDMGACVDCHVASRRGPEQVDCGSCHREIGRAWTPPSHHRSWMTLHGRASRIGEALTVNQCSLCHTESSCTLCHNEVKPRDHDNFWRLRGHAISSSIDRTRCEVCHTPDACAQCHRDNRPRSHSGTYGSPRNRHCLDCHFPLEGESCAVCHESDRSHQLAPIQPSWHRPGMDCRRCHGADIPLRHADNGADCNACHR